MFCNIKYEVIKTLKNILFLYLFLQINLSVKAQGYFTFGYGGLYAPFTELNKMVYLSNVRNNADKKMGKFHFAKGINLAGGYEEYGIGAELRIHNYNTTKRIEYVEGGMSYAQELRMDWTSIALNFTFGEEIKFGTGTNYGGLKFNGNKYLKNGEETDLEPLHSRSKLIRSVFGVSFFGEVPIGDILRIRLAYHINGRVDTGVVRSYINTGIGGPFNPEVSVNAVTLDLYIKLGGY